MTKAQAVKTIIMGLILITQFILLGIQIKYKKYELSPLIIGLNLVNVFIAIL